MTLPDEDVNEFAGFSQRLHTGLSPVGEMEEILVDRIVSATWRLRRVLRIEKEIYRIEMEDLRNIISKYDLGTAFIREGRNGFSNLSRYETAIERGLYRALHELQRLQAVRTINPTQPPVAVDVDVNISKTSAEIQ